MAGKPDIEDLYKVGEEDFMPSDLINAEKIFRKILEIEPEEVLKGQRIKFVPL